MNHTERRAPFQFDYQTKKEALDRALVCEICGEPERPHDRFELNHKVAIWFALENPCLAVEVLKSIANLQVCHHSCHVEYHRNESRAFYAEVAPQVLKAYLDSVINPRLDDWREKLKGAYARSKSAY